MTRTTLYRAYDENDVLLYVGISDMPMVRLESHSFASRWVGFAARVTFERLATRELAAAAEVTAIREEKPVFNIRESTDTARAAEDQYIQTHLDQDALLIYNERKRRAAPQPTVAEFVEESLSRPKVRSMESPSSLAMKWGCTVVEVLLFIESHPKTISTYKLGGTDRFIRYQPDDVDHIHKEDFMQWREQFQFGMNYLVEVMP